MISLLIPNNGTNCFDLIACLHDQCMSKGISFEILVGEDAMGYEIPGANALAYVRILEPTGTSSRSANRNRLAKAARYAWLLFLDSDAEIDNPEFVSNYLNAFVEVDVVCGGTAYELHHPDDPSLFLRWRYGIEREVRPAAVRSQHGFNSFSSFNFAIQRTLFLKHSFDESLLQYGHEDTLLGQELLQAGARILHIDNPAVHLGLDGAGVFLAKSRDGVENLARLYREKQLLFPEQVNLLNHFLRFNRWKLTGGISLCFKLLEPFLAKWLMRYAAPMWFFDLYKLGYLSLYVSKMKQ